MFENSESIRRLGRRISIHGSSTHPAVHTYLRACFTLLDKWQLQVLLCFVQLSFMHACVLLQPPPTTPTWFGSCGHSPILHPSIGRREIQQLSPVTVHVLLDAWPCVCDRLPHCQSSSPRKPLCSFFFFLHFKKWLNYKKIRYPKYNGGPNFPRYTKEPSKTTYNLI